MESEPLNLDNNGKELDMGFVDFEHPVDEEEEEDDDMYEYDNPIPGGDTDLEPYVGMQFESEEAAKAFYNSYARRVGFSTRISLSRRSKHNYSIIQRSFVCAKEGFRVEKEKTVDDGKIRRPRPVTRVGCKAMLALKILDSGKWVVTAFEKEHNHDLVPQDRVHCLRSHRHVSGSAKSLIDTLQAAGIGPSGIMSALIKEYGGVSHIGFTERDCRNYMKSNRQKTLGGDTQIVLDYVKHMKDENPGFFYAVQGDEDQCMSNIFWADQNARTNYIHFSDTVTFDATYRLNRYRLPFAPFTGVNHHGQPVLFGCALLINESEESFVWLFKTWLTAMSGRPPVSITTDHDRVIRSAITHVFPETRHRFCKWNIFKEGQEKLAHVYLQHPNFEAEFHKCVNLTESTDEFESSWLSLVDTYNLKENVWLQLIYDARKQWVPVYIRDTFFAEMSITQRGDSINSYFDGYINASTTLQMFIKLYEKALESRLEKEVKADYETMSIAPILKTPSPMEKQAAELYTKKLFSKFQEELVETLSFVATNMEDDGPTTKFRVAKFGDKSRAHIVNMNFVEMKATCSCQMFECSGLLCRHVLSVFKVSNVLTLPLQYILKRWTRNAKSRVVLEERPSNFSSSYHESHTVRYNSLRHEALKYVDEGAKTIDTYIVAMRALQDASKRVALAKTNGGKLLKDNENSQEDCATEGRHSSDEHQWASNQHEAVVTSTFYEESSVVGRNNDDDSVVPEKPKECTEIVMDYKDLFTTHELFETRERLCEWVRSRGKENGMVIIISRSNSGAGKQKAYVLLTCERSGQYRDKNKNKGVEDVEGTRKRRRETGSKKCECPFRLIGKQVGVDEWELTVHCGLHNHPTMEYLDGHSYLGRLSMEERAYVVESSNSNSKPKDILLGLKQKFADNKSTIKAVYNARMRKKVIERGGRSEMQQLM